MASSAHPLSYTAFAGFITDYKLPLIAVSVGSLCMLVMESPTSPLPFSQHWNSLSIYFAIPLITLAILKQRPSTWAINFRGWQHWLRPCALYLAIALPLIMVGNINAGMKDYYHTAPGHWPSYIATTAIYLLGWEYFFRGFLISSLRKHFREGAIVIQMIPFTLLHLGKPDIEVASCIISGIVWGYICYHARSFWPAFFMHLIVNIFNALWISGVFVVIA